MAIDLVDAVIASRQVEHVASRRRRSPDASRQPTLIGPAQLSDSRPAIGTLGWRITQLSLAISAHIRERRHDFIVEQLRNFYAPMLSSRDEPVWLLHFEALIPSYDHLDQTLDAPQRKLLPAH